MTRPKFEVKPLYSLREFSSLTGIPRRTLCYWAKRGKLRTERIGDAHFIPVAVFRDDFPMLWESILLHQSLGGWQFRQ